MRYSVPLLLSALLGCASFALQANVVINTIVAHEKAQAVAAIIAAVTNGAAHFRIRDKQSPLAGSRKQIVNKFLSLVQESAIYDDDQFSEVVDEALRHRGFYFSPLGETYSVPELGGSRELSV